MKASRQWRRRNQEQRQQGWGSRRRKFEVVPRSAFGRVELVKQLPVAWFSAGDGELVEVYGDGSARSADGRGR